MPDIFLSHSSRDKEQVRLIKEELVAQGFSVSLDIDVLPAIRPADVTADTAESLRRAMRECSALVYVITANSRRSRWMPWELGYFDGFRGRVFIYPVDDAAERNAQGIEYLRIYPKVPLAGRAGYLAEFIPKEQRSTETLGGVELVIAEAKRSPMFDYADQVATGVYGNRLQKGLAVAPTDFADIMSTWAEIGTAWLRLWNLAPPPERPGALQGPWKPKP